MPKCKICNKRASFGLPNGVAEYCKHDKHDGMVNVVLKNKKINKNTNTNTNNNTANEEEELPRTLKDMKQYVKKYTDMFHDACHFGNLDNLAEVIKRGIDLEDRRDERGTGLVRACVFGYEKLVDLLLQSGAKDHYQNDKGKFVYGLIKASNSGNASTVEVLIKHGCPLNVKDAYTYNRTALMIASANHDPEIVKLLIDGGADVNEKDNYGYTALMCLCSRGGHNQAKAEEVCKLLINGGANVNIHSGRESALWLACDNNPSLINILIKARADTKMRNKDGRTILMEASSHYDHISSVEELLKAGVGVDINTQNKKNGYTALMYASQQGELSTVKALLKAGADIFIQNKDGKTASMIAEVKGHRFIVEELKKASEIKN